MKSVRPRFVLAFALALAASACADDPEPANTVREVVGPDGGIVTSHDGVLTIVLQPGALDEPVEIEVFPSVEPPAIFGPAYRVRPNLELAFDAEITYRRVLPEDTEGVAVAAIRLVDYEDGMGHWEPLLPVLRVDTGTNEVVGGDEELALYYGLVEDATPDDPTAGGTSGGDDTGGGDDTNLPPLSHAADIQPIWNASCMSGGDGTEAVCHAAVSDTPLHDLVLEGDAYQVLLGQAVGANLAYVEPGDPEASYLVHKIDGTQLDVGGSGSAMPLLLDPLPEATRQFIRTWIEQGAMP